MSNNEKTIIVNGIMNKVKRVLRKLNVNLTNKE